jgi:hypothetical protein
MTLEEREYQRRHRNDPVHLTPEARGLFAKWHWLLFGLLAFGLYRWGSTHLNLSSRYLLSSFRPSRVFAGQPDPCDKKERCVVVAVAPDCLYCRTMSPYFLALRDRWKSSSRIGLKIVVVGVENSDSVEPEAARLGDNTYIDTKFTFEKETGSHWLPTYVVLDSNKKIIGLATELFKDSEPDSEQKLLKHLGLTNYAAG